MEYSNETNYMKGFLPYALAAFLVGIVGGLSTVLGPSFMLDMNLAYNNTTWTALAQAISTAACASIRGTDFEGFRLAGTYVDLFYHMCRIYVTMLFYTSRTDLCQKAFKEF